MIVRVIPAWQEGKFTVQLQQGCQSFKLDYRGTKEECEWMAKMFRIALVFHDQEKQELKGEPVVVQVGVARTRAAKPGVKARHSKSRKNHSVRTRTVATSA